jgi:hypothetical protein
MHIETVEPLDRLVNSMDLALHHEIVRHQPQLSLALPSQRRNNAAAQEILDAYRVRNQLQHPDRALLVHDAIRHRTYNQTYPNNNMERRVIPRPVVLGLFMEIHCLSVEYRYDRLCGGRLRGRLAATMRAQSPSVWL